MQHASDSNMTERIKLFKHKYYTLSGIKYTYRLGDMSYGQWLVFKANKPYYYLDTFRDEYKDILKNVSGDIENFLRRKLAEKAGSLSLEDSVFGIRSSETSEEWIELQYLPRSILE